MALLAADGISWLDLDEVIDPSADIGIAGLLATEDSCFLAMQGTRPRIVKLGRDLRVSAELELEWAVDLHSLAERNGMLYAASTGRNQILSIRHEGARSSQEERVCFTAGSSKKDSIHLNSVCFAGDTLIFSMFGPKRGTGARQGALVDATSGAPLRERILDPHSLTYLGNGVVAFCESVTSSFCLLELGTDALRKARLAGYTRGCAFTGRHFVVGSSRWRHKSRSLGSFRDVPTSCDPHGNPWQRSSVYFLNPDLSVAHQLDFTRYAPEIYDIAYVGTRFQAARTFQDAAARRLDAMYDEIHRVNEPVRRDYSKRA